MENKLIKNLDTISTIAWLSMDFCWMTDYTFLSSAFGLISLLAAVVATIMLSRQDKASEFYLGMASSYWISMNMFWMIGDQLEFSLSFTVAKICFAISIICLIIALVFSKKEGGKIDFKRLKIK